jgi:predicted  nucleic acid-binding Zn-ribbon protein
MEQKPPAVTCLSCERSWNSASMAEGLRLLGGCPRCGGELKFAADETGATAQDRVVPRAADGIAPHLVLGIPRR